MFHLLQCIADCVSWLGSSQPGNDDGIFFCNFLYADQLEASTVMQIYILAVVRVDDCQTGKEGTY